MNLDEFYNRINMWRLQLAELMQHDPQAPLQSELVMKSFEQFKVVLEELTLAQEELWAQNQELLNIRLALEAERQRYQELFEFAPDAYLITDTSGIIQQLNRPASNLLKFSPDYLVGKPLILFIHEQQHLAFYGKLEQLKQLDGVGEWEVRLKLRNLDLVDVSITIATVRDRFGQLIGLRWLLRDITERKRIEAERNLLLASEQLARQEAEESQTRVTSILERITDAFIALDNNWCYTYVNSQAQKLLRKSVEDLLGTNFWEIFPLSSESQTYQLFHQAIADQVKLTYEEFFPEFNKWFAIRLYPSEDGLSVYFLDITEQKQAEAVLRYSEQLVQSNRMKDEFLAILSHELRSPLSVILGWAQMLRAGNLDASTTARALEIIERSTKTQTQLIQDLLDVFQIITGKLCISVHPIEITPIIKTALDKISPLVEAKQIKLRCELSQVGIICGDAERLQQVMWHLFSNAVKFTPDRGSIKIRLENEPDHGTTQPQFVKITVSDTGIGISAEFLPFVFERFRQADSTITRVYNGMGLGLALVDHIVKLHGGTIHVASAGEGKGTTFTVRLPLK